MEDNLAPPIFSAPANQQIYQRHFNRTFFRLVITNDESIVSAPLPSAFSYTPPPPLLQHPEPPLLQHSTSSSTSLLPPLQHPVSSSTPPPPPLSPRHMPPQYSTRPSRFLSVPTQYSVLPIRTPPPPPPDVQPNELIVFVAETVSAFGWIIPLLYSNAVSVDKKLDAILIPLSLLHLFTLTGRLIFKSTRLRYFYHGMSLLVGFAAVILSIVLLKENIVVRRCKIVAGCFTIITGFLKFFEAMNRRN